MDASQRGQIMGLPDSERVANAKQTERHPPLGRQKAMLLGGNNFPPIAQSDAVEIRDALHNRGKRARFRDFAVYQ